MKIFETLRKAQKLIERPENWCQGSYRQGNRFCMPGAMSRADPTGCASNFFYETVVWDSIVCFNDAADTTHLHAMMAFDFAIYAAEDAGQ